MAEKEFVNVTELVEISGLASSTIYRLCKSGRLPGAGWAPSEPRRNREHGNSLPRYYWMIHLETFLAWWGARPLSGGLPPTTGNALPPVDAEADAISRPVSLTRIPESLKSLITSLRAGNRTAADIVRMLAMPANANALGGRTVPSLATVRRIAQAYDDEHGRTHLEGKRVRGPDGIERLQVMPPTPDANPPTDGHWALREPEKTYEYNTDQKVILSQSESFTCANCNAESWSRDRLLVVVIRPGRQPLHKDLVTHVLCCADCAIKFIDQKEASEWQASTLKFNMEPTLEITFPLAEPAPNLQPVTSPPTGNLWRRFRALVGGNG